MKILSLDTSTHVFSLAVLQNKMILVSRQIQLKKVLSDSIIPTIDQVLEKAGLSLEEIDGFAVGLGPGSFTSLRVGLSTAKAFALTLKKPLVGFCSLDAVATAMISSSWKNFCAIRDAKRNMVYVRHYRKRNKTELKARTPCRLVDIQEALRSVADDTIFWGDGINLYQDEIRKHFFKIRKKVFFAQEKDWIPCAEVLGLLALEKFQKKKIARPEKIVPLYLYRQDCQVRT